ncbi:EAL domain-containing protein [Cohnella cellulosilytica]|uniref:EAL domain-containing protein n=1 Tax=Cohnella cellulosilytica TaxID=986710 RepID=A0ABW2FAM4_9BACL
MTFEQYHCYSLFQPIVWLEDQRVYGYEALLRSSEKILPDHLFRLARTRNDLYELDCRAMAGSISTYFQQIGHDEPAAWLFVNVFPSTLLNPAFSKWIVQDMLNSRFPLNQIILEINEAPEEEKMWDIGLLGEKLSEMRRYGFRIALDDVGSGAASLKKIVEYEPDIVKLDRYFGKQLARNTAKQRLVSLFAEFCRGEMLLVLEGIEHADDLSVARSLGVPLGQGYLLGRPAARRHPSFDYSH